MNVYQVLYGFVVFLIRERLKGEADGLGANISYQL
jgi:hypothetical protein